jgi:GNAT superfamily N-acetyltransferase
LRFEVGCDLEEFRKYLKTSGIHDYLKWVGVTDLVYGELGPVELAHIQSDPSHLIVWREGKEMIGHAIWHEEQVDRFNLSAEEKEVRRVLKKLLGEKKSFVELHELWLEERHRGKGYGKKFFEFFEDFIKKRGFHSIVYFSGNTSAIGICRKRGYKEDALSFPEKERWHIFYLSL